MINRQGILGKLSYKFIVLQLGFLYLFSQAAHRFFYTWNYEISECLYLNGHESGFGCLEKYPAYTMGELFAGPIHWILSGLLIGAVFTGVICWVKKKHILNALAVLVIYVLLFFAGAFKFFPDLDSMLLFLGGILTKKFWVMNFMVVLIYFISGLVLFWLSVRNEHTLKTESKYVGNL